MQKITIFSLLSGSILISAFIFLALWFPYSVDDAFISFRITRNFWEHGIPYFHLQEAVYTSTSLVYPFWNTLWAALIGQDWVYWIPVINGILLGLACTIVFSKAINSWSRVSLTGAFAAYILVFPWFLEYKTVVYGNSGLETSLYMMLLAWILIPGAKGPQKIAAPLSWFLVLVRPEGILAGLAQVIFQKKPKEIRPILSHLLMGIVALSLWAFLGWILFDTPVPRSILAKSHHLIDRSSEIRKGLGYLLFANHPLEFGVFIGAFWWLPELRKKFQLPLIWAFLYIGFFSFGAAWWPWYLPPLFIVFWYIVVVSATGLIYKLNDWVPNSFYYQLLLAALLITLTIRAVLSIREQINLIQNSSEAYQTREKSSAKIGQYLRDLPSGKSVLLEPLGLIGWHSGKRKLLDYPGLCTPEMEAAISDLGWKIPHRLTDPKTDSAILSIFKPDFLVLWPEEVNAFLKVKQFRNDYRKEKKFEYYPMEKRMDSVAIFRSIRN